ncbi:MAG: hypothetical protein AAF604_01810 [Acidobacteriota bacterium]
MTPQWLAQAMASIRDGSRQDASAVRSELAAICRLYAQLFRLSSDSLEALEEKKRLLGLELCLGEVAEIHFLPLGARNQLGFSYLRTTPGASAHLFSFETSQLLPDHPWPAIGNQHLSRSDEKQATNKEGSAPPPVRCRILERGREDFHIFEALRNSLRQFADEPDRRLRSESEAGPGELVTIEQRVEDSPDCMILLVREPSSEPLSEQEVQRIEAATRLFFESYRVLRLQSINESYRSLVNDRLLLEDFTAGLQKVRGQAAPNTDWSEDSTARFLHFFLTTLADADALPEMDNAYFFPLVGAKSYLFQAPPPREREQRVSVLVPREIGVLPIQRPQSLTDTRPEGLPDAGARLCWDLYSKRLRLLATAQEDSSNEVLQPRLEELAEAIRQATDSPLGHETQSQTSGGSTLIGVVHGALFGSTHWAEWMFGEIEPDFLQFRASRNTARDFEVFGSSGSLIALLVLFDHLPPGVLFLNSSQPFVFTEEDLIDVSGIAKAYFQTFQLKRLSQIVGNYQDLESQLTVGRTLQTSTGSLNDWEFSSALRAFLGELFASFETTRFAVWLPLDRDDALLGRSTRDRQVIFEHFSIREAIEETLAATASSQQQLQLLEFPEPSDEGSKTLSWLYRWSMAQIVGRQSSANLPTLEEIAALLPKDEGQSPLDALILAACFSACLFDLEFPFLRSLLRRVGGWQAELPTTGSAMGVGIFCDGLPKGLLVMLSADELSFTPAIELRDLKLAVRTFVLPAQLASRDLVVGEYQRLLLEREEKDRFDFNSQLEAFLKRMGTALATLESAFFLPLSSESFRGLKSQRSLSWNCKDLTVFGSNDPAILASVNSRLAQYEKSLENPHEELLEGAGDCALQRLYLRCLRDLLEGRHQPEGYALDELVADFFVDQHASNSDGSLRTLVRAYCWPTCQPDQVFPYLNKLVELRPAPNRHDGITSLGTSWSSEGSLLVALLLVEGLPHGLIFLSSPIRGSFSDQERQDVEAATKVVFEDGQTHYREKVITAYRRVVGEILSEDSLSQLAARQAGSSSPNVQLARDDEFGTYMAGFMKTLFQAYSEQEALHLVYIPFEGTRLYYSNCPNDQMVLDSIDLSQLQPPPIGWPQHCHQWLESTVDKLSRRSGDLSKTGAEGVNPDRGHTDHCLGTMLLPGHRFNQPTEQGQPAFLKPFLEPLSHHGVPWQDWQSGSTLLTAILYRDLPSSGVLLMTSPIPWWFTEHDRKDVEAIAKAYFLTYRSISLKVKAARAARLSGMQQVLLGVTHRLKNGLQPTYNVIKELRAILKKDPSEIGPAICELDRIGQIEGGAHGIEQVQKKFAMLRSIVTGARQPKKPRSLSDLIETYTGLISGHDMTTNNRSQADSQGISLHLNTLPEPLAEVLPELNVDNLLNKDSEIWIDITEGIEEVLSIYAENTVKAVQEARLGEIFLILIQPPDNSDSIEVLIFDEVLIPTEKLKYIETGEVIPTEIGGGSGTGFYNARNLLELNADGRQQVLSSPELGGTLIRLELPVLLTNPIPVGVAEVEANLRNTVQTLADLQQDKMPRTPWTYETIGRTQAQVELYNGSYCWDRELFNLTAQVFLQRHANRIERSKDREDLGLPALEDDYHVKARFLPEDSSSVSVEIADSVQGAFYEGYGGEDHGLDQFARNHNRPSLLGPQGAVGELFLAMKERVERDSSITISLAPNEDGFTTIKITIPARRFSQ